MNLSQDCVAHLHEEAIHTDAYSLDTPTIEGALQELEVEFGPSFIDQVLLKEALAKTRVRVARRNEVYNETVRHPVISH